MTFDAEHLWAEVVNMIEKSIKANFIIKLYHGDHDGDVNFSIVNNHGENIYIQVKSNSISIYGKNAKLIRNVTLDKRDLLKLGQLVLDVKDLHENNAKDLCLNFFNFKENSISSVDELDDDE